MSTNANIAIINTDGNADVIYTHWDGYPRHHAPILKNYYNTEEKVRELINLGDLSVLGSKIGPSDDKSDYDTVIAYHRDQEEDWESVRPLHKENIEDVRKNLEVEFLYAFDCNTGKWSMSNGGAFEEI